MIEYPHRMTPTVYVLETVPKYIFSSKAQARMKYKSMGYSAYKAPVTTHTFNNKQDLFDFICHQIRYGDNDERVVSRDDL